METGIETNSPIISVKNLTKYYGDFPALQGVSFDLQKNEALGLLGLNGAGKTTLIRILSGFLIPSAGNVTIGGMQLADHPLEIKTLLGYLPETPPLYQEMTVTEYLTFVAGLKGLEPSAIDSQLDYSMTSTSLTDVRNRLISELSLGYRKRVGIAQAIIHKPEVVILDEPISGLDPKQIIEMRSLIQELKKEHTVIISSHILSEIAQTCDRFLIIHKGKIVREETADSVVVQSSEPASENVKLTFTPNASLSELAGKLSNLPGIKSAEAISGEEEAIKVEANLGNDWKLEAIKTASESGLTLTSIQPFEPGLESLFMELLS